MKNKNNSPKVEDNKKNSRVERKSDNQKKGLSFKEQREFEQLTQTIEDLETEKTELESFFSSGRIDTDGSKQKRYREVTGSLDSCYLRWEKLAELAES